MDRTFHHNTFSSVTISHPSAYMKTLSQGLSLTLVLEQENGQSDNVYVSLDSLIWNKVNLLQC